MNKIIKLFLPLLTCIALCICGCGSVDYSVVPFTEEDGTRVEQGESGDTYFFESMPRTITYDEKEIKLSNISFYEDKLKHSYNLYVLVDFDMLDLTEDDIYWMEKERDLDVSVYVDDEDNRFDNETLSLLRKVRLSDGTYRFAFCTSGVYRYNLCGASCDVSIHMTQEDTYEYKNSKGERRELNKEDTYYYFGCPIPDQLESSDAIIEE